MMSIQDMSDDDLAAAVAREVLRRRKAPTVLDWKLAHSVLDETSPGAWRTKLWDACYQEGRELTARAICEAALGAVRAQGGEG